VLGCVRFQVLDDGFSMSNVSLVAELKVRFEHHTSILSYLIPMHKSERRLPCLWHGRKRKRSKTPHHNISLHLGNCGSLRLP
jgi:hypothetical protein